MCSSDLLVPLLQEFFVKKADRVELMSFVGLFGAIIGAIQMYPSNEKG